MLLSPKAQFLEQTETIEKSNLRFYKVFFYDTSPKKITSEINLRVSRFFYTFNSILSNIRSALISTISIKSAKNYNYQFNELGIKDFIHITALSKNSINLIYNKIKSNIINSFSSKTSKENNALSHENIRISIVGKPNVGKSTLYNLLYGKERVVTASLAGTTRDSVMSEINHKKYICA